MTGKEFAAKCMELLNYKTCYAKGTFGQYATNATINTKAKQYPAWYTKKRIEMLKALTDDTRLFDCAGVVKGVCWNFPNIVYKSNGVSDMNDQMLWDACKERSNDFSKIEVGSLLWMQGHVGVYVGEGKAIECTASWQNKVMLTAVSNIGTIPGLNHRRWTGHGKLPFITYDATGGPNSQEKNTGEEKPVGNVYVVKAGDTFTKIANKYGMTNAQLKALNPQIKNINIIHVGDKINVKATTTAQAPKDNAQYYVVKAGDTVSKICANYKISQKTFLSLNPGIKNPNIIYKGQKVRVK